MSQKTLTRSFAGGELSEQLFGRLDLGKYQTGLARCLNFVITPQGPAENRAGFEFVRAVKDSAKKTRLIPFTYSSTQTLVIELGAGYFRFHTDGATVLGGGVPYEVANTYAESELFDIHYVQSGDVLTLTHPSHAPAELRRLGATSWTLADIGFVPTLATPATPTSVTGGAGGGTPSDQIYVTTAIADGTLEESLPSAAITVSYDLTVAGNYVEVQPAVVAGAVRYNVYKQISGLYGYIGQTSGAAFRDTNITPDVTQTPPLVSQPFAIGAIASVPLIAGGALYGSVPLSGGVIDSVTVTAAGTGYAAPAATASGGSGSGAILVASQAAGFVTDIAITDGGSLYASPTITVTDGGGGAGATATATATPIVAHEVTLSVTDATGAGAVLEAVVVGQAITGVRVVSGGSGYTAPVIGVSEAAGGGGANFGPPVLTAATVNPGAATYYEQRRTFAGSTLKPQNVWATRSGTESNMGYSIPARDDDAITARAAARKADTIRHLVPLNDLLALTSGGVWKITASDGGALTPNSISVKPQGYVGANNAQPITTSNSILYAQARGGRVRELSYQWQSQRYDASDLSILAPHLFDYRSITDLAYSETPQQILWAVRDDGVLLGMTYSPEHEVKAWHQHTTDGLFESACAVAEGSEDALYVVVKRTINGAAVRYVERLHSRNFAALEDCFFVDAGSSYDGVAATVISGLDHLEGETVSILADGGVEPQQVVTGGQITLTAAASKVHVGLPYTCDLQGMPLSTETAQALGQGMPKNIDKAWLSVYRSSGLQVGPSFDKLREYAQRTPAVAYGAPPPLVTDVVPLNLSPQWTQGGQWCLRQSDPLPVTVRAITLEYAAGG